MKRLKLFLGAAALAAVALTASPAVNAQENGNRDENGRIVRGPYQTNAFGDNWFIGAGGGIKVTPIAFLIVKEGSVRMLPVAAPANTTADRIVEMIPDTLDKISSFVETKLKKDE